MTFTMGNNDAQSNSNLGLGAGAARGAGGSFRQAALAGRDETGCRAAVRSHERIAARDAARTLAEGRPVAARAAAATGWRAGGLFVPAAVQDRAAGEGQLTGLATAGGRS